MSLWVLLPLGVVWWAVGAAGFIWTWKRRHDFTSKELTTAVLAGILGPLAWLLGWFTVIRKPFDKIVIRKRQQQ